MQFISYKKSDIHRPTAAKPKKEWDVSKDRWRGLGFHVSMTADEAQGRARQLNAQLFIKGIQEERIKNNEKLRRCTRRRHEPFLAEEFTSEFELRFVRTRECDTRSESGEELALNRFGKPPRE